MKVLHINSYDSKGGAETVFQITRMIQTTENLTGFVKLGHSNETSDINFNSWETDNKLLGAINYIFSFHNYLQLSRFLKSSDVDVIHLHGFFASLSPSVLLAIKKYKKTEKIKVVQTLHDFHLVCPNAGLYNYSKNVICEKCIGKKVKLSVFANNCDRRGWTFSYIKGIRSFLANNLLKQRNIIDNLICPSDFMKSKMIEDGIEPEKLIVIRNPVLIKDASAIEKKKNIICYFGRFSKEKNLEFLITAFSAWKEKKENNFQLLLIGEGEEHNNLRLSAANSSSKDDIIFKNFMTRENLEETLKEVKYLSLTSSCYENAPMTIIEALSQNILSIVPNIGGMRESIQSVVKCGIIYVSGEIESWIDSVIYLENNYEEQIRMLEQSKENIGKELSMQNFYNSILNIYKSRDSYLQTDKTI